MQSNRLVILEQKKEITDQYSHDSRYKIFNKIQQHIIRILHHYHQMSFIQDILIGLPCKSF